jgi:hypothetical protein
VFSDIFIFTGKDKVLLEKQSEVFFIFDGLYVLAIKKVTIYQRKDAKAQRSKNRLCFLVIIAALCC